MSLNIQDLVGGSIADGIAKIISLFKIDPTVALEKQVELQEIQLKMQSDAAAALASQIQGQIDTNKAEAASGDKFTSRWRPMVGYICGFGLASNFIIAPFFTWLSAIAGYHVVYPTLDMSTMMPVLLGMLGLAGAHVTENVMTTQAKGNK
jgi:hypothetical protein